MTQPSHPLKIPMFAALNLAGLMMLATSLMAPPGIVPVFTGLIAALCFTAGVAMLLEARDRGFEKSGHTLAGTLIAYGLAAAMTAGTIQILDRNLQSPHHWREAAKHDPKPLRECVSWRAKTYAGSTKTQPRRTFLEPVEYAVRAALKECGSRYQSQQEEAEQARIASQAETRALSILEQDKADRQVIQVPTNPEAPAP